MKSVVDKLLEKLDKHTVDNDKEFLNCLIDLDYRLKKLEEKTGATDGTTRNHKLLVKEETKKTDDMERNEKRNNSNVWGGVMF